ncbi:MULTISPECIES: amidohydrolase [Prochlorococcus]|uniref:Probable N-acyl-L-amino acid amidohydrolase n=1 Tax=Prochlorococcus marinus (strain SARG / CCMP1375 / SS120) TaxID=167539 RepID=Q7V9Q6_PROMA|nr:MULTISPECIES: amidohydrolase [Prochlorococcus]AAQ00817.1 Probable N-acyl-L-amino acid amidohydrolase [Prochlorococcus marinus subsp. marinus str. CCMP1375]KGG10688.1 N-acetyl-L,L-diaminopimelate deacetylase-like [Prochlorococcus marinus str. LG]KGG21109.1 N-acetyl-L,L-diaminopimelate deacetylase-like [Prochlorococcus marinus str. SS2]KGG23934.1 N-acetyl-L,L-diaminopimelate deacetylase-like [Prochlorococcus marinus str. SS35]KGG31806.1 N-acetyl-L,L-diaminopimelate deacetylase-like [Prochloro
MTIFQEPILSLKSFLPELIELRRYLHAHPELSGHEHQTAALIAGELRKYGWIVKESVGRTGLIAELGNCDGPLVGFRVDMDALPVEEKTGLSFASLRQGVMHACGHDIHICIGIGLARLLAEHNQLELTGIRLLFQPAEEIASGARWMKEDGATKGLDALFGVHVYPELPSGHIGVRDGTLTAAAGKLEIEIIGDGGHGARPHQTVDSIWIAAKIISGIQEAISRQLDALLPVVISFGQIEGGKAFNVIADRVKLLGTVRCLDAHLNDQLPHWLETTIKGIATSCGAEVVITYTPIAPPVFNDPKLTALLENCAQSLIGNEKVKRLDSPSLGAEDFAEFLDDVPGTMFRLGVAPPEGCAPLHNGSFAPDENSIEIGINIIFHTLMHWMKQQQNVSLEQ